VVRNDGCVEWAGALHEDFKENRKLTVFFIKGIERLHLSDEKRFDFAKHRNYEIAKKTAEENLDDPRTNFNLGNASLADGRWQEALDAFNLFLHYSQSEDEKYIAYLRMSSAHWSLDKEKALEDLRYAIGMKPEYPDAYNRMGAVLIELKRPKEAVEYLKLGLQKKPPYYEIIVFNPRDYDYTPLMNLAKAYFQLSLPTLAKPCLDACLQIYPDNKDLKKICKQMDKQALKFEKIYKVIEGLSDITDKVELKKKFDAIPVEFKNHPMVCKIRNLNFIKEESSGKDLVIYCAYTNEEWTPDTAKTKGIGGSEEAVIHLSQNLAEQGWNVTVYNNCGHKELKFGNVTYKPFWSFNYRDKQDVAIIWRHPLTTDYDINAKVVVVDLHDVLLPGEFTESRLRNIDKIFVKSQFHRSFYPKVPDDKFVIIPNGITPEDLVGEERDEWLMINTSSPDRSLRTLVDIFPKIKEKLPKVKCFWAYGWKVFDSTHANNGVMMRWKHDLIADMEKVGIVDLGRLGHGEVAKLYQKAKVFAYPSEFAEIDCISLTKALVAGAVPVTTDFAAMGEKSKYGGVYIHSEKTKDDWCQPYQFDFGLKLHTDRFVLGLEEAFNNEIKIDSEQVKRDFNWKHISEQWNKHLTSLLNT
jgi:glycosyltransferase involved in cell wall biosynthesis